MSEYLAFRQMLASVHMRREREGGREETVLEQYNNKSFLILHFWCRDCLASFKPPYIHNVSLNQQFHVLASTALEPLQLVGFDNLHDIYGFRLWATSKDCRSHSPTSYAIYYLRLVAQISSILHQQRSWSLKVASPISSSKP